MRRHAYIDDEFLYVDDPDTLDYQFRGAYDEYCFVTCRRWNGDTFGCVLNVNMVAPDDKYSERYLTIADGSFELPGSDELVSGEVYEPSEMPDGLDSALYDMAQTLYHQMPRDVADELESLLDEYLDRMGR